jgi:hypothetical protein
MASAESQLKPKNAHACEACRALKVRCLPSGGAICQKCLRSGSQCIFAERKIRSRSFKPTSKARVHALETKLDDLIAHVGRSQASTSNSSPELGQHSAGLFTPQSQPDFSPRVSIGLSDGFPRITGDLTMPSLLFEKCGLSLVEAEGFLRDFRKMSLDYFPFVIIPDEATTLSMSRQHPFLLLAAIAAASSSKKPVQQELDKQFQASVLHKVMLDGEKSLDLLQGSY